MTIKYANKKINNYAKYMQSATQSIQKVNYANDGLIND